MGKKGPILNVNKQEIWQSLKKTFGTHVEKFFVFKTLKNKHGRFPVQTPLGAWPRLGTQSRYEAPGDDRVEIDKTQ